MTNLYDHHNIFAKILKGEIQCFSIYEDDIALAFMDIMPRSQGHSLVIPKVEARHFLDMPSEMLGPFMQRVQYVAQAVMKAMQAEGLTVHQFNEAAGGQVIFHLHVHLLPRWSGKALGPSGIMGDRELIARHAEQIRSFLCSPYR